MQRLYFLITNKYTTGSDYPRSTHCVNNVITITFDCYNEYLSIVAEETAMIHVNCAIKRRETFSI